MADTAFVVAEDDGASVVLTEEGGLPALSVEVNGEELYKTITLNTEMSLVGLYGTVLQNYGFDDEEDECDEDRYEEVFEAACDFLCTLLEVDQPDTFADTFVNDMIDTVVEKIESDWGTCVNL